MSGGNIIREDIRHEDIVDAVEQISDGTTSVIFTGATVVSTTSSTKTVVLSGVDLLRDPEIIENLDIIVLAGTSSGAADGTYTVDARVDGTSFTVNETIADSTGGTCEARNPSGARRTGFDATGLTVVTANNVQDAIEELDAQGAGSGITAAQHKALRQLIHFVETNSPGDGFGSGPYYSETLPAADPFPTSETWWETSSKTNKICRWEGTYNANKTFATEKWIVYKSDGTNPAADATDTISYSGVFETSRSRAIVVY